MEMVASILLLVGLLCIPFLIIWCRFYIGIPNYLERISKEMMELNINLEKLQKTLDK